MGPDLEILWSDGRQDVETRAEHARRTRNLHKTNPTYHQSALRGLDKGRRQGRWPADAILAAIGGFRARAGRWPGQQDFRVANELPSYGTVRRRFGSAVLAAQLAAERTSIRHGGR